MKQNRFFLSSGWRSKPCLAVISTGSPPSHFPKTKNPKRKVSGPDRDVSIIVFAVFSLHTRTAVFSGMDSLEEVRVRVRIGIGIAVRIRIALCVRRRLVRSATRV